MREQDGASRAEPYYPNGVKSQLLELFQLKGKARAFVSIHITIMKKHIYNNHLLKIFSSRITFEKHKVWQST